MYEALWVSLERKWLQVNFVWTLRGNKSFYEYCEFHRKYTCLMNSPLSLWYVDEILLKKLHVVMKWKCTLCVHFLNDTKNATKSSKRFTHRKIFSFFYPIFIIIFRMTMYHISSEYKKCNKNNFELHFIFQDYYYYSLFSCTKKFLGKPIIRQYNRLYHSTIH